MIRVVVAEDSPTARMLLEEILRSEPDLELAAVTTDGREAVEAVQRLQPDVVSMDIQMPRMDGFEATKRIMAENPTPIVVVSSLDVKDVAVSLEALRAGALAVVAKPASPTSPRFAEDRQQLLTTIKAMAGVRLIRRPARGRRAAVAPARPSMPRLAPRPLGGARTVGIAASTGGPAALQQLLGELPADFPAPILVVQHIAIGFAEGLAAWLDGSSRLTVKLAEDGEPPEPGSVYVAPDSRHLVLGSNPSRILLSASPPVDGLRPSANVLFESMARSSGRTGLGVILTGMGRDGVEGLAALRTAGGRIVAQDESSSEIFGMPAAAIEAGLPDAIVPLHEVAATLRQAVASSGSGTG